MTMMLRWLAGDAALGLTALAASLLAGCAAPVGGVDDVDPAEEAILFPRPLELDPTFGAGGVVTGCPAGASLIQTDALGRLYAAGKGAGERGAFPIARYAENGVLDTTWDGDGVALNRFAMNHGTNAIGLDFIDGYWPVVSGWVLQDGFPSSTLHAGTVRHLSNGQPDAGFGRVGTWEQPYGADYMPWAQVVDSSDRVVLVAISPTGDDPPVLMRVSAAGTLDTTFGFLGFATATVAGLSTTSARALAIDGTGRLIVSGFGVHPTLGEVIFLSRHRANGPRDTTFGSGGSVLLPFPAPTEHVIALSVRADGRIVLVTRQVATDSGRAVVRVFTDTGSLDPAYGASGEASISLAWPDVATLDHAGRVLIAGRRTLAEGEPVRVYRMRADGSVDPIMRDGVVLPLVDVEALHEDARGRVYAGVSYSPDQPCQLIRLGTGPFDIRTP